MWTINILTPFNKEEFSRQLPKHRFEDFHFYENGPSNIVYDLLIVYEGLSKPQNVKYKNGNILFIAGEPPMSRVYTQHFLDQFDYVISSHRNIKHSNHIQTQQALPWHFGYDLESKKYRFDYEHLESLQFPIKTKKMSVIASNKKMMPGHKKRYRFIKDLKTAFGDEIDFYGKGVNLINDKANAILPYYMTICIENSTIDNYWTEKIADAYLGYTFPIYHGCKNINSFFPTDSFETLNLENKTESLKKVKFLLDNAEELYFHKKDSIIQARKLLLRKYNIYPFLVELIKKNNINNNGKIVEKMVIPNHECGGYKKSLYTLKVKRFIHRSLNYGD